MTHSEYERQSNIAAGLCASCTKPLKPDETHVCQKCCLDMSINELVFHVTGEDMRMADD